MVSACMSGTRGSGVLSSTSDMLVRGVGGVCDMCMCLARGGVGGEGVSGGEKWVWALPILWGKGECLKTIHLHHHLHFYNIQQQNNNHTQKYCESRNSHTLSATQHTRQTDPLTNQHIKYTNITLHLPQLRPKG